jgi:hypothetical protein
MSTVIFDFIMAAIVVSILYVTLFHGKTMSPPTPPAVEQKAMPCVGTGTDYLVSVEMTKFLENEGHGKVFDEGDME